MNTACSAGRTEKHCCKWSAACTAVIAVFLGAPMRQARHKGSRVDLCFLKEVFPGLFFFNLKILRSFV